MDTIYCFSNVDLSDLGLTILAILLYEINVKVAYIEGKIIILTVINVTFGSVKSFYLIFKLIDNNKKYKKCFTTYFKTIILIYIETK